MLQRGALLGIAILIIALMVFLVAYVVLPAPPVAPTPTWPMGIDLPDKLPRIPY